MADPGWSWWHKYVAVKVVERDLVGGSPDVEHNYVYNTDGSSTAVLWGHDDGPATWASPMANRSYADWRGYSTVITTVGTTAGPRSITKNLYFRGLRNDWAGSAEDRASAITNSQGVTWTDWSWRTGWLWETVKYKDTATPYTVPLEKTLYEPEPHSTGSRTYNSLWAIPTVFESTIVRNRATKPWVWIADTSVWRQMQTNQDWDPTYGVLTQTEDLGDVGSAADDTCTRLSYTYNTSGGKYLIDFPKRQETVGVACTVTPSYPADALGDTRHSYDQGAYNAAPTKGDVTRTEQAKSFTGTTPKYITTVTATYDTTYGRLLSSTDALGNQSTTAYTDNTAGLLTTTVVTNPAIHAMTTTFNPSRGLPLTIQDANNKITTGSYDALGRMVKVTKPGRSVSLPGHLEYTYSVTKTAPSWVATKVLGPNDNQITSYEIYDGLLRSRQTQSPVSVQSGGRLIVDTAYDVRGAPAKRSTFWNNASAPTFTLATFTDSAVPTQSRSTYDEFGRVLTSQLWSLGVEKWRTTTAYDGNRVDVTPPDGGTATRTYFDAKGATTELRQFTATGTPTGAYLSTSYTYDELGRMKTATDPGPNQWTWTYDLLGRTTQTADPDKGTTTFEYDDETTSTRPPTPAAWSCATTRTRCIGSPPPGMTRPASPACNAPRTPTTRSPRASSPRPRRSTAATPTPRRSAVTTTATGRSAQPPLSQRPKAPSPVKPGPPAPPTTSTDRSTPKACPQVEGCRPKPSPTPTTTTPTLSLRLALTRTSPRPATTRGARSTRPSTAPPANRSAKATP